MIYLLDTDHISLIERGGNAGSAILRRLKDIPPDDYGVTIVSFQEQVEGRLLDIKNARNAEETIKAFAELNDTLRFFSSLSVSQFTPEAAAYFAQFRREKLRVGTQDLRIAAIALANDATLLTCNRRDFEKVPDLRVEDWSL